LLARSKRKSRGAPQPQRPKVHNPTKLRPESRLSNATLKEERPFDTVSNRYDKVISRKRYDNWWRRSSIAQESALSVRLHSHGERMTEQFNEFAGNQNCGRIASENQEATAVPLQTAKDLGRHCKSFLRIPRLADFDLRRPTNQGRLPFKLLRLSTIVGLPVRRGGWSAWR
jgi:hypothetical protein